MVTTSPNHGIKTGASVQSSDGDNAMDAHPESGAALAGTSASSSSTCDASPQNGPGVTEEQAKVDMTTSSSVIQAPCENPQSGASSQGAGPTVTVVMASMQTAGSGLTVNGNSAVVTTSVNVANQPATCSGISAQTKVSGSNIQAPMPVSTGALSKPDPPKTTVQTTAQTPPPGGVVSMLNPAAGQAVVLQSIPRAAATAPVASSPGGVRALAPQVFSTRLPASSQTQSNIQNIQLPPGMVLVRSDSGQLLMIHQQSLAQLQVQSQAPRAALATSSSPALTSSNRVTGVVRQVTPPSIIKQVLPAASLLPTSTTTLQRPPTLQSAASGGTVLSVQGGATQGTIPVATGTTIAMAPETLENVKKCKNFLSTLIKLACSGKQSSETAATVKDLVKSVLEGKIEAEDFTSRLYKELKSSPLPYLVPFLKRSLPSLRQLTPDSNAFIQQSQESQAPKAASGGQSSPSPRTLIQPARSTAGQPASLVLQSQQIGTGVKPPQVTLATAPMVTIRGQTHSRIVVGQPQVQLKQLQTVPIMKQGMLDAGASVAVAQRNRLKDGPGGTFRDDDDINDVTSMAGVNLSEESARILATNSELVGVVMRSCRDETFLYHSNLHKRMQAIGKKFGITELGSEVVSLISHATQQRLQNLLEKLTVAAQQRNFPFKEDSRYEQTSDVRTQLKFFEQLDQMEKQRKEEQEREILMKAAKSRARQEDPEQLRLKQKAKKMLQQELSQMWKTEADLTALAAIGDRRKRKRNSLAQGTDAEGSGSSLGLSAGSAVGASRQFTRQRITRISLRDLLLCLEGERDSGRLQLLYRTLLK